MHTALQALRSEDKALLERCLTVGNTDVIRNTVARLQVGARSASLKGDYTHSLAFSAFRCIDLQAQPCSGHVVWTDCSIAMWSAMLIVARLCARRRTQPRS